MRKDGDRLLERARRSAMAESFHQRFLYLFDESLGKLLRENPEVERRVNVLTAEIFEILAAGLRKSARR